MIGGSAALEKVSLMKRMRFSVAFIAILSGICLLACALQSRAQERRYIEVVGRGTVTAKPDVARIEAQIAASKESSRKALEAFLEKKGKFNTAVSPMNFEGIKVEFDRTSIAPPEVSAQAMMMGGFGGADVVEAEESAAQISVAEIATIEIPGLDKMEEDQVKRLVAKIYDEIKSNGGTPVAAQVNQFSIITGQQSRDIKYLISKPRPIVEKGQIEAMGDARTKATHLAKLSGGKLGRVISVKELDAEMGGDEPSMEEVMMQVYGMSKSAGAFASDSFAEIKVEVKLKVQFELED